MCDFLKVKGTGASLEPCICASRLKEAAAQVLTPGCSLQQCQVRKGIVKATKQLSDILPNSSSCQKNYVLC